MSVDKRIHPPEQGSYTVQLRATLDRKLTCNVSVMDGPTSVLSSEQGGYTVKLCATFDRWAPFVR